MEAWSRAAISMADVTPWLGDPGVYPYGRKKIFDTPEVEILVMNWAGGRDCAPHDHGSSLGWVHVLAGTVNHTIYTLDQRDAPVASGTRVERAGTLFFAPRGLVHAMGNPTDETTVTVHIYSPPITGMKVFDLEKCAACVVSDDCGAWWPDEQRQIVQILKLGRATRPAAAHVGGLGLSELANDLVSNDAVRSALRTREIAVDSLAALDGQVTALNRLLMTWSLGPERSGRTLRASRGGATLIVVSGRVELIPLDRPGDAVLLGEAQTRELAADQPFLVRLSQSSKQASLVEVSYDVSPSVEIPDGGDALTSIPIPPIPDYYYGYSDRYAAVYSAGGVTWEPEAPNEVLIDALGTLGVDGGSVIDLGCGEGRDSIYLASRGFAVTGVDVARPALEKARSRAAEAGVRPTFLERDVVDLRDLPEGAFDLAINMGCLHMIPDADLRARHLSRVRELLRPGGLFLLAHCREHWGEGFFSIPNYDAAAPLVPGRVLDRRIRLANGEMATLPLPLVPYKESSEAELVAELTAAGFETVADLSKPTQAFGNTVVLAVRRVR